MTTLEVRLLGEFAIFQNATPLTTVKSPRLQSLLAYLLLHRDAPVARQRLAFLFWPDSSEAQARSNLRNLIHALIQALPEGEQFVETDNQTVQWRAGAPYTVDVDSLLGALANAQTERDLREALDLYPGALLPGCYDDWIAEERERLEQMLSDVLQRFVDQWEKEGKYRSAITYAQKLVRRDPLREDLYRQIMRLYALSGDRAGVARTYKECQAVLARELDVEPSRQTQEAYDKYKRLEPPVPPPAVIPPPSSPVDPSSQPTPPLPPPEPGPIVVPSPSCMPPSDRQIRRAILSDALQHPATEVPLALAALDGLYLLLYHSVLGLGEAALYAALLVLPLSLLASVGSFFWLYALNFDKAYADKSKVLQKQQQHSSQEQEEASLAEQRRRLTEGFSETRLAEGHCTLRDLDYEYAQLKIVFDRHKETDLLSLSYLPALVDETYRQGLNVLEDVLELARATSSQHIQRLEAEIKELEDKVREARKKKGAEERANLYEERVKANHARLNMIEKECLRRDELLTQAKKCEAALHQTRMQVASLADTGSVKAVLETLQTTIDQARAVQEEMRKLGY